MPLYEYLCPRCGRFELIQKFSDPVLTACPTCGQDVQKLLSAPAFQFKGTGWYVTDYARKASSAEGEASRTKTTTEGGKEGKQSASTGPAKEGSGGGTSTG